jgi:tetratricopeptide (TPR) repeat protein
MRELPGVTLACVDTANHALALRALERCAQGLRFARTLFFTDALPSGLTLPPNVESVNIPRIDSRDAYSRFVLKDLAAHVATSHVLLVQWDGYVVHPEAWEDAFLDCDYLGARWFWFTDGHDVGNGGFSLRSRRLLEALQDPRIVLDEAEDLTIGRTFRDLLEREHGIRFATGALADRFAFEAAYPVGRPFGFHGLFNFCRVMPSAELAALAPSFSDAIAGSVQIAQLLRNCVALGQWAAAIALARRVLAARPEHEEARVLLAQSEAALAQGAGIGRNDPCPCGSGKRYKACHGAPGALDAKAASPDALVARAMAAHQRGELDAAERDYRAALAAAAEHPHALHYLGVIEWQRGRPLAALPMLERAAALVPQEPEFHNNLGLVLAVLDRPADAADAYRRALALAPGNAGAWNNLGLALQAGNHVDEAADAFRRALALAPDFTQARWNLALALLGAGRDRDAWPYYEARREIAAFADLVPPPATPRWDGSDPRGRTILLTPEQGLGDAIQFVRFVPLLAARGARVVLQAARPLLPLFRDVAGVANVVAADDPRPAHDAWLPLLSLPGSLGLGAEDVPVQVPYLAAAALRIAEVQEAMGPRSGRELRVGLAWAGNPRNAIDHRRSVKLARLVPLLDLPGVRWFSLASGDGEDQIARVPQATVLERLDARKDFAGTAAMLAALDLVVTVDTSIGHLAGALARPTFVMLPFAADWRWRTARTDSPWYPTLRLFRQEAPGDWESVVASVAGAIGTLTRSR